MIRVGILTCEADIEAAARVSEALSNEDAQCISNFDLGHAENFGQAESDALREIFSPETALCFVLLSKSFLARAKLYKLYDEYIIQARTRPRFLIGTVIDDSQEFYPPYSGIRALDFFRYGLQTIVARFRQLPSVRQEVHKDQINIIRIKKALEDIRNNFIVEEVTKPAELSSYFLIRVTDRVELADSSYYLIAKFPQVTISGIVATFNSLHPEISKAKLRVILPKPRRGAINPEVTLRSFADSFQVAAERVSYLDGFFSRLSDVTAPSTRTRFDPLFVPVKSILEDPGVITATDIDDTLEYVIRWATSDDHDPLLVMTAPGGYGKTTFIRKVYDSLIAQNRHVIYLDANEFIDHFRRSNVSITQSTLYEVLKSSGGSFNLKENEFYLGWSLNNFIVIIDGLDEIISRLAVDLNVTGFLRDIIESNEDGGGKIILTAREVFWDSSRDVDVKRIYLKPFDEAQAQSLFTKYFHGQFGQEIQPTLLSDIIKICMDDANAVGSALHDAYQLETHSRMYVPFMLEYIANEHSYLQKSDKPLARIFTPSSVRRATSILDAIESLIEAIARREYFKMGESSAGLAEARSVELQFELLSLLAAAEGGCVTGLQFDRYVDQIYGPSITPGRREQLKIHFLLLRRSSGDVSFIEFRYDFVRSLFAAKRIEALIAQSDALKLDDIRLMADYITFDNELLRFIAPRLENSKTDLVGFFLNATTAIKEGGYLTQYDRARFIWSVASIILQVELLHQAKLNIHLATDVIKSYFGATREGASFIEDFAIVNHGTEKSRRVVFDWAAITLRRCIFWEYSAFWDCRFDEQTRFEDCLVREIPDPPTRVAPLVLGLFASNCDLPENVSERLAHFSIRKQDERDYFRSRLRLFLQKFMSGGRATNHVGETEMVSFAFPRMKVRTMKFAEFIKIMDEHKILAKVKAEGGGNWYYEIPKETRRDVEDFIYQGLEPARIRLLLNDLLSQRR